MEGAVNDFMAWIAFIGLVVAGGFGVYSLFDKGLNNKRKEENCVDDRLINLLKGTVENLEREVKLLKEKHEKNVLEIAQLRTENSIITKILQGRDEQTARFQREGFVSFSNINELLTLIKEKKVV